MVTNQRTIEEYSVMKYIVLETRNARAKRVIVDSNETVQEKLTEL